MLFYGIKQENYFKKSKKKIKINPISKLIIQGNLETKSK